MKIKCTSDDGTYVKVCNSSANRLLFIEMRCGIGDELASAYVSREDAIKIRAAIDKYINNQLIED